MDNTKVLMLLGAGAVAYYLMSRQASPAKAEPFSGVDNVAQSLAAAKISNMAKDEPWQTRKEINSVNSGAISGVGWPMFTFQLPRMDDRNF
jgi:hypothetical protein